MKIEIEIADELIAIIKLAAGEQPIEKYLSVAINTSLMFACTHMDEVHQVPFINQVTDIMKRNIDKEGSR